jgi:hypothetical protein
MSQWYLDGYKVIDLFSIVNSHSELLRLFQTGK